MKNKLPLDNIIVIVIIAVAIGSYMGFIRPMLLEDNKKKSISDYGQKKGK